MMKYSLSARLTYRIMAVVLVMMAVITSVVYFSVKEYMRDEAKERYLGILLREHEEVRRRLSDVYVAVRNNVHDIERDIDHPDQMYSHMQRIVEMNPSIVCCAMLFEPHYYPAKGRVFVPCARRDSTNRLRVMAIDSTYHSHYFDERFLPQLQADTSEWLNPYVESQMFAGDEEQRLLTTYTMPVHNHQGRPVAMLCADLSLKWLKKELTEDIQDINQKFEQGQEHQSYFFVVDREGTCIMHPDLSRVMKPFDRRVGHMMNAHRGTCVTEVDGVVSRLYYRTIKYTGWIMVIVTPEDVILSNAYQLNIIILVAMLLGLVAIYLLCRHHIKKIADPFAAQKAAVDRELTIAHDIQMAMLPSTLHLPPSTLHLPPSTLDLHASLTPAHDVGGDLYDYFVRDHRLFFCIGDVSGKGVPAALMMAVVKAMFRGESQRAERAVDIVDMMNRNLSEEYTAGYFVTMFVGILDLTTGRLDYCNAGHEPPLLSEKGRVIATPHSQGEKSEEFAAALPVKQNLPVGALSDWSYEGQHIQLQPGDLLFLYTDGLSEAKNAAGEQFGRKHVAELANEHLSDTVRQLVETMMAAVQRHAGDARQSDDITLLALRWQPASPAHQQHSAKLEMAASMDDIAPLAPFIAQATEQAAITGREAKRLRLAVEEAVANIINHGQATTITLHTAVEEHQLVVTIIDDGQPFDPTQPSPTDLSVPPDQRPPGGLGIMLIHQMTDGLDYQRSDGHNVLRLMKEMKEMKK